MEKAKVNVPVMIQEMIMVSKVPIALQLMDFTILRFGLSEFLSFLKEAFSFLFEIISWSAIIFIIL